jgi:regulator of sirC expression with transglutaminase-like and TPR domain
VSSPGPEFQSILRLLDDDNPTVRDAVSRKLASYGPELETALESAPADQRSQAVELQRLYQRNEFLETWSSWIAEPTGIAKLESGLGFLASYLCQGEIEPDAVTAKLDRIAAEFRRRYSELNFRNLAEFLFHGGHFEGDEDRYYDPDNSNFARVLARQRGNPISLACVFILVGDRLDLDVGGCNYPAHFLARARCPEDGELYLIDCFNEGKIIPAADLIKHHPLALKEVREVVTLPAAAETIISRVLRNLDNACEHNEQHEERAFVGRLWQMLVDGCDSE